MSQQNWWQAAVKEFDQQSRQNAYQRQLQLTKPPGALGKLEQVAIDLAAMQGCDRPDVDKVYISIFAADHGVAAEGVSAFPQEVTAEMIRNFSNGGAAICVLAKRCQANFEVVNLGTVVELDELPAVVDAKISASTANFCQQAAMTDSQLQAALSAGASAVDRAVNMGAKLFVGGEMGIANTTSASAVAAAILRLDAELLTGPGTGVNQQGVRLKAELINRAIALHRGEEKTPIEVLRYFGGFEIAALAAAYIRCAQQGVTILVDGFISSVAALLATELNNAVAGWLIYSHGSAEPGHRLVLEALNAEPLVDFKMRLGEGSGAVLAVGMVRAAVACHNEMATFGDAGVTTKG